MFASLKDIEGRAFDYIIIGGGTAGIPLAVRLSEDSSISVLLLEAGEAHLNDPVLLLPAQRMKYLGNPDYDWDFKTVNQSHSNNRAYTWNRGKVLGGSSAINNLLWNNPSREYLDAFAQLGNPGWSWEIFEKYHKRSERFTPPDHDLDVLTFDTAHRGQDGAVSVSFPTLVSGLEIPAIEAMRKLGIEKISDTVSGHVNGIGATAATVDPTSYLRSYSASAHQATLESRKNLLILTSAQASSINTKKNPDGTVTATGVTFLHKGSTYEVKCSREVCLCAGTIMSPQILELSGIGDRAVLEKAGVETKVHLPGVGTNVQEHLYSGVTYHVKADEYEGRTLYTYDALYEPEEAKRQFALHSSGKGLLNMGVVSLAFFPLDAMCSDLPKMHELISETIRAGIKSGKYPSGLVKQYELQLKHLEDKVPSPELMLGPGAIIPPLPLDPTRKHMTICFGFNSPFSRGTIHVASKNPLEHPIIDPHIFEEPYDLAAVVELIKFSRKIANTEPLSPLLGEEVRPGPRYKTDEEIAEWVKDEVSTTWHTVGSCSMLPLEDGGVVDAKLKVYHTTNIRIADLSIVPLHIGSHTQAMAYALGEIAADIIKGII